VVRRQLGEPHDAVPPAAGGAFEDEVALMRRELARHWSVLA
jgi:hypothetical protein